MSEKSKKPGDFHDVFPKNFAGHFSDIYGVVADLHQDIESLTDPERLLLIDGEGRRLLKVLDANEEELFGTPSDVSRLSKELYNALLKEKLAGFAKTRKCLIDLLNSVAIPERFVLEEKEEVRGVFNDDEYRPDEEFLVPDVSGLPEEFFYPAFVWKGRMVKLTDSDRVFVGKKEILVKYGCRKSKVKPGLVPDANNGIAYEVISEVVEVVEDLPRGGTQMTKCVVCNDGLHDFLIGIGGLKILQ